MAQNATIWGPGENYEIDYLQSGEYQLNNVSQISFTNEPSAEFTLSNITNEGYDYVYIGYDQLSDMDSILMQQVSFGFGSMVVPTGGMPVALPLSYGETDDWIEQFSTQLNELSQIGEEQSDGLFNANSTTDNEFMYIEFLVKANSSVEAPDAFFDLPQLQVDEFEGKNNTYVNSTLKGSLSYKLSTGVLFDLNITLTADQLLVDGEEQGQLFNSQSLEFVAIIPPASIIDEIRFDILFVVAVLILIPFRSKLRQVAMKK